MAYPWLGESSSGGKEKYGALSPQLALGKKGGSGWSKEGGQRASMANTFPSKLWLHRRPIFVSRAALTSCQRQITTRVFIYSSFFPSLILFPVFQFQFLLLFCYSACHSAFSFPFNSSPVTFLLSMGPRVFRLVSLGIRARRFSEVNTWEMQSYDETRPVSGRPASQPFNYVSDASNYRGPGLRL